MLQKQTFCIREDQLNDLNSFSKRTGVPKAEAVRRAIDLFLKYMPQSDWSLNVPNSTT